MKRTTIVASLGAHFEIIHKGPTHYLYEDSQSIRVVYGNVHAVGCDVVRIIREGIKSKRQQCLKDILLPTVGEHPVDTKTDREILNF